MNPISVLIQHHFIKERGEIGATYSDLWYMIYTLVMNAFAIYICMQAYKSVYILSSLGHGNLLSW